MTFSVRSILVATAVLLSACGSGDTVKTADSCASNAKIGRFDTTNDLFLAHFDIKTDTDDLHSAAAVATMLSHPDFACVNYRAVSGTYGTQGGDYVDPQDIFADAFGENWVDAHGDRAGAISRLTDDVYTTMANGGYVWIMEGGQSDVSAAVLRRLRDKNPNIPLDVINIVQHSDWNESVTSKDALDFVKTRASYIKIPDGNGVGNGTPGFRTEHGSAWPALLAHPEMGDIWADVRALALAKNGGGSDDESIAATGYNNQAIGAGGLDFSDTAEAMWIFGYESLTDVDDFVRVFLDGSE